MCLLCVRCVFCCVFDVCSQCLMDVHVVVNFGQKFSSPGMILDLVEGRHPRHAPLPPLSVLLSPLPRRVFMLLLLFDALDSLLLSLPLGDACAAIRKRIESAPSSLKTRLKNAIHGLATEYVLDGDDDVPESPSQPESPENSEEKTRREVGEVYLVCAFDVCLMCV